MMKSSALKEYRVVLFFVAIIWLVEIVNYLLAHQLNQFGLIPRQFSGLLGIVTMHFLHGDFNHLVVNTAPLLILGFLVSVNKKTVPITISIALTSGLLVWLMGRSGHHIGASGLVMGYFGYLLSVAFFQKSLKSILITVVTVFVYGGLIATLIDFRSWVSFEGHFFGFLAGIASARVWHPKPEY